MKIKKPLLVLLTLTLYTTTFADPNATPQTWQVLTQTAQLHAEPNMDAKITGQVKQNETLIQTDTTTGTWIQINHQQKTAYIHTAYILLQTKPKLDKTGNIPIGTEIVNRQNPLPLHYKPTDLTPIDKKWDYHTHGTTKKLRKEANTALDQLFNAAKKQDIHLRVVSAYRSAAQQKYLYLKKIKNTGPDQKLVAKPGHSEHQLGTTIDVSTTDPETVLKPEFANTPQGKWLNENAQRFGFRFTYTEATQNKTGFKPEPWHIRYIGNQQQIQPPLPTQHNQ